MIYLGGPYTSDTLYEHKMNIGRLLAYKIWIWHDSEVSMPIVCWPLETSGFDKIPKLDKVLWLDYALELAKLASFGAFVPGSLDSPGARAEMEMLESLGINYKILSPMTWETKKHLSKLIEPSIDFNKNFHFALLYLCKRS